VTLHSKLLWENNENKTHLEWSADYLAAGNRLELRVNGRSLLLSDSYEKKTTLVDI